MEDVLCYIMEHMPCRILSKFTFKKNDAFAIEIRLRKILWMVMTQIFPIYRYI